MAKPQSSTYGALAAAISSITNVETLAVTSGILAIARQLAHVIIMGSVQVTSGATGGTLTVKIRRGSALTDTLVYTSDAIAVVAAKKIAIPFNFNEDLANAAQAQYTVSVTYSVNEAGCSIDLAHIVVVSQ